MSEQAPQSGPAEQVDYVTASIDELYLRELETQIEFEKLENERIRKAFEEAELEERRRQLEADHRKLDTSLNARASELNDGRWRAVDEHRNLLRMVDPAQPDSVKAYNEIQEKLKADEERDSAQHAPQRVLGIDEAPDTDRSVHGLYGSSKVSREAHQEDHYDRTNEEQGYDNLSMVQLAARLKEAIKYGDATIASDLDEALDKKIDDYVNHLAESRSMRPHILDDGKEKGKVIDPREILKARLVGGEDIGSAKDRLEQGGKDRLERARARDRARMEAFKAQQNGDQGQEVATDNDAIVSQEDAPKSAGSADAPVSTPEPAPAAPEAPVLDPSPSLDPNGAPVPGQLPPDMPPLAPQAPPTHNPDAAPPAPTGVDPSNALVVQPLPPAIVITNPSNPNAAPGWPAPFDPNAAPVPGQLPPDMPPLAPQAPPTHNPDAAPPAPTPLDPNAEVDRSAYIVRAIPKDERDRRTRRHPSRTSVATPAAPPQNELSIVGKVWKRLKFGPMGHRSPELENGVPTRAKTRPPRSSSPPRPIKPNLIMLQGVPSLLAQKRANNNTSRFYVEPKKR